MGNFAAIGFAAPDSDAVEGMIGLAIKQARKPRELGALASKYLWFQDAGGAAMALRLDANNAVQCITPFFVPPDGGARWLVHTKAAHLDLECLHCSGADCDVLDAETREMCTRTALQFVCFEPYQAWLSEERTFEVTVVGFASHLALCSSDEEFEQAQANCFGGVDPEKPEGPGNPFRLADQAFLPAGMFGDEGKLGSRARALLTGKLESVKLVGNSISGLQFVHARIRTFFGLVDIVAAQDEVNIPDNPTLALAECWLVGRPSQPPVRDQGFFKRLFGRA